MIAKVTNNYFITTDLMKIIGVIGRSVYCDNSCMGTFGILHIDMWDLGF
jgi:hypothetical protein